VKFRYSQLTLSLVTTPTEKLSVQVPCDSNKNFLCCRMEKYTTVSLQELIPINNKGIYKRQHY